MVWVGMNYSWGQLIRLIRETVVSSTGRAYFAFTDKDYRVLILFSSVSFVVFYLGMVSVCLRSSHHNDATNYPGTVPCSSAKG